MDNSINLYEHYTKQFEIFAEKFNQYQIELSKIISDENTVKQILASRKDYCQLSPEINKLLIKYSDEYFTRYLEYIKNYIEKKFMDNKTNDYIKEKLFDNIPPLEFNDIYSVLLNELISKDFISNVIEYSDNQLVVINPDDYKNTKPKIENYVPRPNQQEAFDRLEKNGLETGIHCQATGCGKTIIILHYIDYCGKKFGNNCKIIFFTERISILTDLFDFNTGGGEANKDNIKYWKEKGIVDLTNFNIINSATKKDTKWVNKVNESKKPTLLVINRAYLTKGSKYKKLNNLSLILHDECHNTTSVQCHRFLLNQKRKSIPIVGFSATPLRTGKNDLPKLKEIYDNPDPLLTNYNMIYSIGLGLILPPEFFWYHIDKIMLDKKDKDAINDIEIGTVMNILQEIINRMPNKKLVAWCGKINMANKWKKAFVNNHKKYNQLYNFKFFVDTSQNINDEYEQFKKLDGCGILFCANKHREGSDIRNLDGCLFLDRVKNRGCIPFIQSIGRVLRLNGKDKKKGFIIDGIYKDEHYDKHFIDKIIGYYCNLENKIGELTEDNESKLETYVRIRDMVQFDKNKEKITIKMGDSEIIINLNTLDWADVIKNFDTLLQKKMKTSAEDNLMIKGKILVEKFGFNIRTSFKNAYKKISDKDKEEYNLPDINSEENQKIIKRKTWFGILNLQHTYYKNMDIAKKELIKNKIKLEDAKNNWKKWCKIDNRLPPYPRYVWENFNYRFFNTKKNNIAWL